MENGIAPDAVKGIVGERQSFPVGLKEPNSDFAGKRPLPSFAQVSGEISRAVTEAPRLAMTTAAVPWPQP